MTTIELEPGAAHEHAVTDGRNSMWRNSAFPDIRWGAIFAGVVVGVSIQLVLNLLSIASVLSTVDVSKNETVGNGPIIWAGFSMLVAAFIGGYVAARLSGLKRKVDGMMHGAVCWAVTMLLFVGLMTSASGSLLSGIFSSVAPSLIHSGANAAAPNSSSGSMLSGQIGQRVDPATLQTLQRYISTGQRDKAIQLVNSLGVEKTHSTEIVDQALILSGSPQQASPQSKAAADRALATASTVAWTTFIAVALSLALGIMGGSIGAITAQRKRWQSNSPMRKKPVVKPA